MACIYLPDNTVGFDFNPVPCDYACIVSFRSDFMYYYEIEFGALVGL